MATDTVNALLGLITEAVKVVQSEYAAAGQTIPSLTDTKPGPFDTQEAASPALAKAVRTIEAACAQLTYTVASPAHVLTNKTYNHCEIACLLTVSNAKIADLLLDHPEGLPVSELAKKSGIDEGKLGRVLRLLVTKHVFSELQPNVFANNRLSIKLLSTDVVNATVGQGADDLHKGTVHLDEILLDPAKTSSYAVNDCAFVKAQGSNPFEFYGIPGNEKYAERFGKAMVGWGEVTGAKILSKAYPWSNLPQDTVICDVGGGMGNVTLDVLQNFPQLKIVLQDLPPLIEQGKELWNKAHPTAVQTGRIQFIPFDFFKEAPVSGCNFYYLRHVLHDWPDAECTTILSNVRKAASPNSRLLIHEIVLQHVVRQDPREITFEQAPPPLLPNFGVAQARLYNQDINMMAIFNSKERTLAEFIDLAEKVGFKFVKLWDTMETGIIEFTAV